MNYLTNDTELIAVADAIREKCDTSDSLEWPDGFIQAIEDCQTGGPELEWLWGNQITNTMSGTIDSTDDAYAGPILNLDVDGVSTQVTTTGKNLLDTTVWREGYYIDNSGNPASYTSSHYSENYSPVIEGSYTLNVHRGTQTDYIRLHGYDANKQWVKQIYAEQYNAGSGWYAKTGIVIDDSVKYVRISAPNSVTEIMLESGASTPDTSYEPYTGGKASPNPDYPQPILSVDELTAILSGWNLFDIAKVNTNVHTVTGTTIKAGGSTAFQDFYSGASMTSTKTYSAAEVENMLYLPAGTYTLKVASASNAIECYYVDPNTRRTGRELVWNVTQKTFTLDNGGYIVLTVRKAGSTVTDLQINAGSTALSYTPFTVGITTVPDLLPEGTELRSLPDGTKDELHLTYLKPSTRDGWAWYSRELVKAVQAEDMGDVVWTYVTDWRGANVFRCDIHRTTSVMCTSYPASPSAYQPVDDSYLRNVGSWTSDLSLVVRDDSYTNVADFVAAVAGQEIHYAIATPVTTTIDPIELPVLPAPNATVWCDGSSAQPTFMLEYIQNSNIVISRLEDTIADLATS